MSEGQLDVDGLRVFQVGMIQGSSLLLARSHSPVV